MRINGTEIYSANPQTDGKRTLTLEEWEEKGRPRTDFIDKVGRKRGVNYETWEECKDGGFKNPGYYFLREFRSKLIDTRRVEYGR